MPAATKLLHLESVRGLAAVAVLASHLIFASFPPADDRVPTIPGYDDPDTRSVLRELYRPVGDGRLFVAVFFVLSGIVLAQGFLRTGRADDLRAAAVKRYVRLAVPATVSVLLACGLWRTGAMHHQQAAAWLASDGLPARWLALFVPESTNWLPAVREAMWDSFFHPGGIRGHGSLNGVLWTMRVELYGSLLVYAYLSLLGGLPWASRGAIVLTVVTAGAGGVFLSLFAAGLWMAYALRAERRVRLPLPAGLVLIGAAMWVGGIYPVGRSELLWLPVFQTVVRAEEAVPAAAAVLIVGGVAFCPRLAGLLSARPLVWLGKISFGLYLIHLPVMLSAGCWAYAAGREAGYTHTAAAGLSAVITVCLSVVGGWAMYHLADRPAVVLAGWVGRRLLEPAPAESGNLPEKMITAGVGHPPAVPLASRGTTLTA